MTEQQGPSGDRDRTTGPRSPWDVPAPQDAYQGYSQAPSSAPQPATYPGGWPRGQVEQPLPPARRGMARIIAGFALMVLTLPAMALGGLIGAVVGGVTEMSDLSAETTTAAQTNTDIPVQPGVVFVAIPEDARASCTVTGQPADSIDVDADSDPTTFDVDGTPYRTISMVTATSSGTVSVLCTGEQPPVRVAQMTLGSFVGGGIIGALVPLLLGVLGLVLLISGLVARSRSKKAQAPTGQGPITA